MKLYCSTSSPYARKVRLLIFEKGLQGVQEIFVNPFEDRTEILSMNPLGQVPFLVLDSGDVLFDSPLICQYLDEWSGGEALIPQHQDRKYTVLRWQAMADGLLDATYNIVMERRRIQSERSSASMASWSEEIASIMNIMERQVAELGDKLTLAHLSVAAAIGYVDFRLPELLYESACPQVAICQNLVNWFEGFKTRPSMLATQPH